MGDLVNRIHVVNIFLVLVIAFLIGYMEYDLDRQDEQTNAVYVPVGNEYGAFVREDEDWLATLEANHEQ